MNNEDHVPRPRPERELRLPFSHSGGRPHGPTDGQPWTTEAIPWGSFEVSAIELQYLDVQPVAPFNLRIKLSPGNEYAGQARPWTEAGPGWWRYSFPKPWHLPRLTTTTLEIPALDGAMVLSAALVAEMSQGNHELSPMSSEDEAVDVPIVSLSRREIERALRATRRARGRLKRANADDPGDPAVALLDIAERALRACLRL